MGFDAELTLALNSNDGAARDRLLGHVHEDLRRIARAELSRHRRGDTLNTQALVNEAYLKLFGGAAATFENRKHFFATAARAMRQVLIDHSRVTKPGRKVQLDEIRELLLPATQEATSPEVALAVKMVFEELRKMDPKVAETVWLRTVEGLTTAELSRFQGREVWRVRADYDFGLQWMANRLKRYV